VIAGSPEDIAAVEALRVPFVYRRYLDYRAFGELRDMKARISQELMRNRHPDNVKLGAGGIREIEFIGQVFQLIRGGTEAALQQRGIIGVLEHAGRKGHLPPAIVAKLIDAYRFLRTVENRLQQFDDEQTHELPGCPHRQQLVAYALGYPDWSSFSTRISRVREQVHDVFEQIMAAPHTEAMPVAVGAGEDPMSERGLRSMGFGDPEGLLELLQRFHSARVIKNLSARGAFELSRLMPLTLRAVSGQSKPVLLLERILDLYQAIASRNVYFSLLVENPLALSQLVKLASGSAWVVHYISQHPILLDELLDPRTLYQPGDRAALKAELEQRLSSVDCGDLEQLMVALRQFKQSNVLRVAASDIIGLTPLMVVSDYLTEIAETVVQAVLQRAWCLTAERHGIPPGANPDEVVGFGIVAYGKLGGIELSYSSDLDLVFLHESGPSDATTNGACPLASSEFYARVAKRVVALMTTQTHAGALYDIDLRLRPSGNSGLLVSSVEAYERYQLEAAWTWEQQSLVRARFVAGDDAVGREFSRIRRASLTRAREIGALRGEVRDMRERMRQHLGERDPSLFDLKQGVGGIADVEFLVQFLVLAYARQHPELIRWTDTIRMLEGLRNVGQLSASDVDQLRTAYCRFRELGHHQALQERPAVVPVSEESELRESVGHIWQRIMAE
ncbi:MAG: bifunctional [glutamate--ammonia ligase]-adenylyl-L-tyrosine phosphorylase/[glutamate--ammonia-ligase] adenylyltransferase, partial [Methylotetracoccus sp.]